jgi:hypothetical protein
VAHRNALRGSAFYLYTASLKSFLKISELLEVGVQKETIVRLEYILKAVVDHFKLKLIEVSRWWGNLENALSIKDILKGTGRGEIALVLYQDISDVRYGASWIIGGRFNEEPDPVRGESLIGNFV